MQAYEGYLEDGRIFSPLGISGVAGNLKGRKRVIVTLVEDEMPDELQAKREASQKLWTTLTEAEKEAEEKGWLSEEEADVLIDAL